MATSNKPWYIGLARQIGTNTDSPHVFRALNVEEAKVVLATLIKCPKEQMVASFIFRCVSGKTPLLEHQEVERNKTKGDR